MYAQRAVFNGCHFFSLAQAKGTKRVATSSQFAQFLFHRGSAVPARTSQVCHRVNGGPLSQNGRNSCMPCSLPFQCWCGFWTASHVAFSWACSVVAVRLLRVGTEFCEPMQVLELPDATRWPQPLVHLRLDSLHVESDQQAHR